MNLFLPHMNTERILKDLKPVLESGWVGLGPQTALLEAELADYWGVDPEGVCCTNSCSEALRLAVQSLELKPWDMVITTPISFISTNHALLWNKVQPLFCDVEPKTGNLSVESVEEALDTHSGVKALVCVHIGGYPCDMEKLNKLAWEHNLTIIEDCAHAMGSQYENGKRVGDSPNICCFSFHAVKNLTCGDGGAIVSDPTDWFKKARWLGINKDTVSRVKGHSYSWEYDVGFVGSKSHLNDIAATIGLAQLEILEEDNKRRAEIAHYYRDNIKTGEMPEYDKRRRSAYHFFPVFFENREKVCEALSKQEIQFSVHYKANHTYPMYLNYYKRDLPGASWYESHELTLPIFPTMSDAQIEQVVEAVNGI